MSCRGLSARLWHGRPRAGQPGGDAHRADGGPLPGEGAADGALAPLGGAGAGRAAAPGAVRPQEDPPTAAAAPERRQVSHRTASGEAGQSQDGVR